MQELTDPSHKPVHNSPAPGISMSNTYLDKAIEAVPELGNRISLFTKKLRLAQYVFADVEPKVDTFVDGKARDQTMLMVDMSAQRAHPVRTKYVILHKTNFKLFL